MTWPSNISHKTFLGKLLRLPLLLIPKNTKVVILGGFGKGLGWIKGSGDNTYWLGRYEKDKEKAFVNMVRSGMTFYDIGAHVGYYTILAARRLENSSHVVSIEPDMENVEYIEKHVALNGLDSVTVLHGAATDHDGKIMFQKGTSSANGYISRKGNVGVPAFRIDTLIEKRGVPPPDIVKIDVQGATMHVLRGMRNTIEKHHPTLLTAVDNGIRTGLETFNNTDVCTFLRKRKYELYSLHGERMSEDNTKLPNEIMAKYDTKSK